LRQKYVRQSTIAASPEVVFAFHENPQALSSLIPPWETMKPVETTGSLQSGSRVVLRGRLGIIPIEWVAIHTEYQPPHLFADRQQSGPFAYWYHTHRFIDDGRGGTILSDEVEYELPFGSIGRLLGGWLVRRKLESMFAYRHERTKSLIESGMWQDEQPINER
jgi:ligand-binding SRPBCC domain-containing protein